MKNHSKIPLLLFISFFFIIAILSVSGIFSKPDQKKGIQSVSTPKKTLGDDKIHFSTSVDNTYYYDNDYVYLYVDLQAGKVENARERTPLNIAIVIDKSGSMAEKNKLDYVKRAVDYIIDEVGPNDYVSIVTFDDNVSVVQRSEIISDKYDLRDKVSHIKPGGFTDLSDGMFEGYSQVDRSYSRGYVNRVFLLTDGLANRGITDVYDLVNKVRDKNRRDGITISTFGVGADFNENLMADIADYGKGNYYYIKNSSDIPDIFASELRGVHDMVGQGTKIKIKFPDEYLMLNKVFGYPYDISGNEISIDFKDVFSEQTKSVLVKFRVRKKIDRKLKFESELSYQDVNSDFRTVTSNDEQFVEPTSSKEIYNRSNNETVVQNISVFESNEMMENALREADNGNYDRAKTEIKSAQDYLSGQMNQVAPSPEMRRQSENMEKYNKDLESADTKSDEEKKEMQKSGKYDNYNSRKKNQ